MTDDILDLPLTKTDDPEILQESLYEARAILEDAMEEAAQAAFTIGAPRGLLPFNEEGEDIEFDEDDLRKSDNASLQAIAKVIDAIRAAIETLPELPDDYFGDEDDDEEG